MLPCSMVMSVEYLWASRKLYIFVEKNWFSLRKIFELPLLKTWFIHLATVEYKYTFSVKQPFY